MSERYTMADRFMLLLNSNLEYYRIGTCYTIKKSLANSSHDFLCFVCGRHRYAILQKGHVRQPNASCLLPNILVLELHI